MEDLKKGAAGVCKPTTKKSGSVIDPVGFTRPNPAAGTGYRTGAEPADKQGDRADSKSAKAVQAEAPCDKMGGEAWEERFNPPTVDAKGAENIDGFEALGDVAERLCEQTRRRRAWNALKGTFRRAGKDVGKPIRWLD